MSLVNHYKIEGITCASCVQVIESNTKKLGSVENVVVNFATETAEVTADESFDEEQFISLLQSLGYRAQNVLKKTSGEKKNQHADLFKAIISIIIGIISMNLTMGPLSQIFSMITNNLILVLLSTIVLIFFGRIYILAVIKFFKSRESNMNTLIGLGVLSAYLYSVVLMIFETHAHTYFEGIPFIIGFTQLGHYLDDLAKTKARSSLSSLYKMQIKFATRIKDDTTENIPVIDLSPGDIIRILPGEKIPLDGIVAQGSSHLDESMLTGESVPLMKGINDKVFAGSINLDGTMRVEVTQKLHDTFVADLVHYVEKAQLKKAPIQKYADRIIYFFVPFIIFFSLATFAVWMIFNTNDRSYTAFSHMIAVLLIACPCALGLAVPMAVMLSTAQAAKNGLLISGGEALEKGASIDVVFFDKTGTLTVGNPVVVHTQVNDEKFHFYAAAMAQYSNHPLSISINNFLKDKKLNPPDPDQFKNIAGLGLEGMIEGKKVLMGNAQLLLKSNIVPIETDLIGSYVYLSADNKCLGLFVIADPIRAKSRECIELLEKNNIEVWMLTGDNQKVADDVAKKLGIKNVKAHVLPVSKAEFLNEFKSKGKKVLMVGDGINDAPALSNAHLGMAMSSGSDVAISASDVSILGGSVELVASFLLLSKRTMRIVKENLFLSFFYNLLCIPLAAGVFYPWYKVSLSPMWASFAMIFSSLSVMINSLRLKK